MSRQEAREHAETQAQNDYSAALGQEITVKFLSAYDEHDDSVDFDGTPIKVRVLDTPADDLRHWVDDFLDPYWNVEPLNLDAIPEAAGKQLRSFWTFGVSYQVRNGDIIREKSS